MRRRAVVKVKVERGLYEQVATAATDRHEPVPWMVARLLREGLATLGVTTYRPADESEPDD